jgi:hypothetical protein
MVGVVAPGWTVRSIRSGGSIFAEPQASHPAHPAPLDRPGGCEPLCDSQVHTQRPIEELDPPRPTNPRRRSASPKQGEHPLNATSDWNHTQTHAHTPKDRQQPAQFVLENWEQLAQVILDRLSANHNQTLVQPTR